MEETYTPNHIPKGERAGYIVFSLLLLGYGTYGSGPMTSTCLAADLAASIFTTHQRG
jgi:hypothetical protein